jgi:hypothetical protein
LPYGVKFVRDAWNYEWDQEMSIVETLEDIDKDGYIENTKVYTVEDIKPYLRPMSSMTEEEKEELKDICTMCNGDPCSTYEYFGIEVFNISRYGTNFESDYTVIDWLNAHHFDYRGLIEKGLALEAPEDMYKK